jgi:hypothetical protein
MNSLIVLHLRVLEESGSRCGIDTSQDRKTFLARVEKEGESFQTITLPSMVKDLYRALDQREVSDNLFPAFTREKGKKIPKFLGGFFRILFDPDSGVLNDGDGPTIGMVEAVRAFIQFTGFAGKLFEQASPKRTEAALERYLVNDARVATADDERDSLLAHLDISKRELRTAAHVLYGKVFATMDRMIRDDLLVPAHGPGSVADYLVGNDKWRQSAFPDQLEDVFPYGKWVFNSWLNYLEEVDSGNVADPGEAMTSKVITVPKTQKTPRIIAIEPTCMQYMQQALRGCFEIALKADKTAHAIVGYEHQELNQLLALEGSVHGNLATLDLSDASDLVSNDLVKYVFNDWPLLSSAIQATRTTHAAVNLERGTEVISLNKFASMGSSLCFPIEAVMFSIMVLVGMRRVTGTDTSLRSLLKRYKGQVRVYGDDIIVPSRFAQSVAYTLEAFGLRVNWDKSFWNGNFRESCGKEYWHGFDVTYVKARFRLPTLQKALSKDVDATVHAVALRNNFYMKGLFECVAWMDDLLGKRLNGIYPEVQPSSSALGRHNYYHYSVDRINRDLQTPLVKAYVVNAVSPKSFLDGNAALMKCLLRNPGLPDSDSKHLLRAGRPAALRIKQRWVSPF